MPVAAGHDEVQFLLFGDPGNLMFRLTGTQARRAGHPGGLHSLRGIQQVLRIGKRLLIRSGLPQEPGGGALDDVDQHEAGAGCAGQGKHLLHDGRVIGSCLKGNPNAAIGARQRGGGGFR